MPAWFIEGLTDPGDVVLDPFLGSGTTVVEAMRLHRRAMGIDIDPLSLSDLAEEYNPVIRGWLQYYGRFYPSALYVLG